MDFYDNTAPAQQPVSNTEQTLLANLKRCYGYDSFRDGQRETILSILSGRDVLCVMPTGGGKSLCYQLPSLQLEGVTLVISPLIALMNDQVDSLARIGIPAAYVSSQQTSTAQTKTLQQLRNGEIKLLYVAPERLENSAFLRAIQNIKVSFVAVDEAHCVSQWGNDFRPSYREIGAFLRSLPVRPVVGAFTATATEPVRADIAEQLKLINPYRVVLSFNRPNLYFQVAQGVKDKDLRILSMIEGFGKKPGIIYCRTRDAVDNIADFLCSHGIKAAGYHAGMSNSDRNIVQQQFMDDKLQVIAATTAFGMGVNKADIAFVIHQSLPESMESYYQEAGRAGRNGEPAGCFLFYSDADFWELFFRIKRDPANPNLTPAEQESVRKSKIHLLYRMRDYVVVPGCYRDKILRYFGEHPQTESCCNCAFCAPEGSPFRFVADKSNDPKAAKTAAKITESIDLTTKQEQNEAQLASGDIKRKPDKIAGWGFVSAGHMHRFADRAAFRKFIIDQGGIWTGSVHENTDFLIRNEGGRETRNSRNAKSSRAITLSEDEFIQRFCRDVPDLPLKESAAPVPSRPLEKSQPVKPAEQVTPRATPVTTVARATPVIPSTAAEQPLQVAAPLQPSPAEGPATAPKPHTIMIALTPDEFRGNKFVVRGQFDSFGSRSAIVSLIVDNGGRVVPNLDGKTKYYITNDIDPVLPSMIAAKTLGVEVLTEVDFIRHFHVQLQTANSSLAPVVLPTPTREVRKPKADITASKEMTSAEPEKLVAPATASQRKTSFFLGAAAARAKSDYKRIIGFDVETANCHQDSICQIGIAYREDGKLIERSWLIDPESEFSSANIRVHHIRPRDVAGKPNFAVVWKELAPLLDGSLMVIHNAAFDVNVLHKVLSHYGITPPDEMYYVCTKELSRRYHPEFPDYKLDTISDIYNISLEHHDAGSDSSACLKIFEHYIEEGLPIYNAVVKINT